MRGAPQNVSSPLPLNSVKMGKDKSAKVAKAEKPSKKAKVEPGAFERELAVAAKMPERGTRVARLCLRCDGARRRERHRIARGAAQYSAQRRGCASAAPCPAAPPEMFPTHRPADAVSRCARFRARSGGAERGGERQRVGRQRGGGAAPAARRPPGACTRPARRAVLTRVRPFPPRQAGDDDKEEAAEEEEADEEEEVRRSAPCIDEPPAAARAHPQPRHPWPPPLPPRRARWG